MACALRRSTQASFKQLCTVSQKMSHSTQFQSIIGYHLSKFGAISVIPPPAGDVAMFLLSNSQRIDPGERDRAGPRQKLTQTKKQSVFFFVLLESNPTMKFGEHLLANISPEYGADSYLNYDLLDDIIRELAETAPSR